MNEIDRCVSTMAKEDMILFGKVMKMPIDGFQKKHERALYSNLEASIRDILQRRNNSLIYPRFIKKKRGYSARRY